jgi:hypothetical protein
VILAAAIVLAVAATGATPALAAKAIALEQLPGTEILGRSLGITHAGDGSGRLFIVSQTGTIVIHDGEGVLDRPFLDISGRITCCDSERGLMSLAFHPDYPRNGELFVTYVGRNGDGVLSRFEVSGDPDRVDRGSEEVLLRVPQPFANHNLGQLAFGPDGMLYVGSGDGGSGGDPNGNGQDLGTLLGAILRIDVDSASPYAIPDDNPFLSEAGAQDEIWAYGLRNPWRFSFDRRNGNLFIGDVGQGEREEINFEPAGGPGGRNYGWKEMEGSICFEPPTGCGDGSMTLPVIEYDHGQGCSVTGGYRYRGPQVPSLPRFYVYGDFCEGTIWGARRNALGRWQSNELRDTDLLITSFGEDEAGNLYVAHFRGPIYRVVGQYLFASDFESGGTGDWSRRRGGLQTVSPGLRGSGRALAVPVDGSGRARFLRSNQPSAETTFVAGFDLDPNDADLGGQEIEIFRLFGVQTHLVLKLDRVGSKYRLGLYARENGGELELVGRTKIGRSRTRAVRIEWTRATGSDAADGEAVLLIDGKVKAAAFDLRNDRLRVDQTRIGLPSGAAGTAGGSFLIDSYYSTP